MLNVIAAGQQYPTSLTVESTVYVGRNGVRHQCARSVALAFGDVANSLTGVLHSTPLTLDTDGLALLNLGCSAPIEVTLTRPDDSVIVLNVQKVLTIDDTFKSVSLKFTPVGEVTQCQFWVSWAAKQS